MHSAQQSKSSYPLAQRLHRDLLASTLFWSNLASQAPVNRFFCDAAAMRKRFGCDAKRESLCEMIDVMTLCWRRCSLHLWRAAELQGDPCPYSFGADTFACCVLGICWSPNGFGKAFAKRWMPHTIEFSYGFQRISFQNAFLRWVFLLQFCLLFTVIWWNGSKNVEKLDYAFA